jgi:hypothetical protein
LPGLPRTDTPFPPHDHKRRTRRPKRKAPRSPSPHTELTRGGAAPAHPAEAKMGQ